MIAAPAIIRETVLDILAEQLAAGREVVVEVQTGSMSPWILPGDRLSVVPLAGRLPRRGEVVARRAGGGLVVHRLLGLRRTRGGRAVLTKGDASAVVDPPAALSAVIGRVARVWREGRQVRAPLRGRHARRLAAWSDLEALLACHPVLRALPAFTRSAGRSMLKWVCKSRAWGGCS